MGELITSRSNGVAIRMRKLFEGYTHNAAGNIAVVVCMLQPEDETTPPRRETIDSIRATIEHLPDGLPAGMITGEPVMLVDGFRFVERDGERLSRWSSALLGLTILVCFRSLRWMLICVGVVQLALLLTKASLSLLGLRLSMVSSMLTAVVTVVGVATVVHVIVRFRDARQQGKQPLRALAQTTRILLVPVFWACITDAAGFAALQSASVRPVRDFGIMMAISCLSSAGQFPPSRPPRVCRADRASSCTVGRPDNAAGRLLTLGASIPGSRNGFHAQLPLRQSGGHIL